MPQDPSFSVSKDDSMNPGDGAINLSFNEQTNDSVIFKGASTNSFKLGDLEWFDSLPVMSDNWWICNIKRRNDVSEKWKKSFNDIIEYEIRACELDLKISYLKVQADSITNKICSLAKICP
ncbi:hypothetical protein BMR1_02g03615 [Babesia microti strain RI]|uniref:Uncharacterized protein n=1 Tax=Babesia microti (strain RI) TaxID=1133968 RepID=I7IQL1_BABMR|nr:hypothetical protein BMR1_02g03615 [Babesia microti strain RI]CCF73875.1 hypothetical protein BMR1_02g03615 [Babesia microti strain RI]|eukprot:XP_012648484.1 hypothetical protein BMR1_02g03615 [Babesia microti strain RI]